MPPEVRAGSSRVLLVVQDDLDGVLRLRADLEAVAPGAFELVHERQVADACRRLSVIDADAVLLDLSDLASGALHEVEAVLAFAGHVPVVVLTHAIDDAHALAAVHMGAQDCLVKGEESPRALLRALRHAIERSALRRELCEAREAATWRATHDPLTGLANRTLFLDRLGHRLEQASRDDRRVGVAFADVDHFKAINDRLGHAAGDALLVHVARALRAGLRGSDTVARFGGDEFALILHDVTATDDVQRVVDGLVHRIEQIAPPPKAPDVRVSLSVGVAVFPTDGETPEQLLATADAHMYAVKRLRHAHQVA